MCIKRGGHNSSEFNPWKIKEDPHNDKMIPSVYVYNKGLGTYLRKRGIYYDNYDTYDFFPEQVSIYIEFL